MVRWNCTKFGNNNPNTYRFVYVCVRSIQGNFSLASTKMFRGFIYFWTHGISQANSAFHPSVAGK